MTGKMLTKCACCPKLTAGRVASVTGFLIPLCSLCAAILGVTLAESGE